MKKRLFVFLGLGLMLTPVLSFAANNNCAFVQSGTIESVICTIGGILNTLIPILVVAGVAFFIFGVVQYVIASDEEAKKKGRNRMIFGIIGLVVIVAMWGLVGIITKTFDLNGAANVNIPCVPGTPGC